MSRPLPNVPACFLCEDPIHALEPVIATTFLFEARTADGALHGSAPVHLSCIVETIAGEVSSAVVHALKSNGRVERGLKRRRGVELHEALGELLVRTIQRYSER